MQRIDKQNVRRASNAPHILVSYRALGLAGGGGGHLGGEVFRLLFDAFT